jgi:hypothetical protein
MNFPEAPAAFIRAACVPVDRSWHASGTLDEAQVILAAHPEVSGSSIHVAPRSWPTTPACAGFWRLIQVQPAPPVGRMDGIR